jgi:large subunit ribosomal protein L3
MIKGLLGKKLGMTHIFDEKGARAAVTLIEAGPCVVQDVMTPKRNGYGAVQLGFDPKREKTAKKPQRDYLASKNLKPMRFVREMECDDVSAVKVGTVVRNSTFQKGDLVDVSSVSKGKGFQGGMKRCGWSGGTNTHGSMSHRAPGSIGASSFPSRVHKGHPMPGHMGADNVTVQNLEVLVVDKEEGTIAIKGAVPGAKGTYVVLRFALKKPVAPREEPEEEAKEEAEAEPKANTESEAHVELAQAEVETEKKEDKE